MNVDSNKSTSGVSILEMMVVLGIMALVIGLAAPRAIGYLDRAKSQTTELQLHEIRGALQLLYIDTGRFPTESEGLGALMVEPGTMSNWRGPYLTDTDALLDPWGRRFVYGLKSHREFELLSLGRDGRVGGVGDDADISL